MDKQPHILNAASNLLGISLLIVTGLNITHTASKTIADEISAAAALIFMASCLLSYFSIRAPTAVNRSGALADRAFILGQLVLLAAIVALMTARLD